MTKDYIIGKGNRLPWNIPSEMKYFARITSNNIVLMGSKTFESIGKPLKNRINIVITNDKFKYKDQKSPNLIFTNNWKKVFKSYKTKYPNKDIFIIGGLSIYQQTFLYADYYYVSIIKGHYEGDVSFSFKNCTDWNKGRLERKKDFDEFTAYVYQTLNKRTPELLQVISEKH